jgi:hypothetical protein
MGAAGQGTRLLIRQIASMRPLACMISTETLKGKAVFSDRGIRSI